MDKNRRHSIFWALILILGGAVLLLNTLGILPGNFIELLLKLWPLLFIIGGLDNIVQGRGWVWAVISLGLGTVFLLANFGYLPWNSWSLLLRMWPLILVALGLDLIFEGRSAPATIIGVLIALVIMAGVAWFAIANSPGARLGTFSITQPLEGATSANVRISDPVGRMELTSGASGDLLLEGTAEVPSKVSLAQDYDVQSKHGSLNLSTGGEGWETWSGGLGEPLWALELTNDVPLDLRAETAAGSLTLDLTGLDIEELNATVAVGSLDVTLDPQDELQGKLSNPVGRLTIRIPEGVLIELRLDTAISTHNLPAGFEKHGNVIYSPNATAANAKIRLTVEQPVGLVSLVVVN
ncbi:MAG: LiaI-LiaF-like domain-containing protein [Bellilinea sp.]